MPLGIRALFFYKTNVMYRITTLLLGIVFVITGCQEVQKTGIPQRSTNRGDDVIEPAEHYLSSEQIEEYIDGKIREEIDIGNDQIIVEAANIIRQSHDAFSALLDNDPVQAEQYIDQAAAKLKLMNMGRREDPEVTSKVEIEVLERVENAEEAALIKGKIDSLLSMGEWQSARYLLPKLANEIKVTHEKLFLPGYLQIMQQAKTLMNAGAYDKVIVLLNNKMEEAILIERSTIPLPLIKARMMIETVEELLRSEGMDKTQIEVLLNNAVYQIQFTDVLGYGDRCEEIDLMLTEIESLRKSVQEDKITEALEEVKSLLGIIEKLKEEVSQFVTSAFESVEY